MNDKDKNKMIINNASGHESTVSPQDSSKESISDGETIVDGDITNLIDENSYNDNFLNPTEEEIEEEIEIADLLNQIDKDCAELYKW
ncbi:MAG: hypothetical protein MR841_09500 [Lactobacillus johnsonii]|nr:hypothetical protein [Lactobacillus johnsonii]